MINLAASVNLTQGCMCSHHMCQDLRTPPYWRFLSLSVVPVWTFITNGTVLMAFIRDRGLRNNLSNVIIASLSVADFLLSILVLPLAVYFKVNTHWNLGFGLHLAWFCSDVFLSASSITNLCVISVYRYLAIAYPYRIRYAMSRRHVILLLSIAWGLALLVSLAVMMEAIIMEQVRGGFAYSSSTNCSLAFFEYHHVNSYMLGSTPFLIYGSLLTFFFPLCVMGFTGIRSIQLLNRHSVIAAGLHNVMAICVNSEIDLDHLSHPHQEMKASAQNDNSLNRGIKDKSPNHSSNSIHLIGTLDKEHGGTLAPNTNSTLENDEHILSPLCQEKNIHLTPNFYYGPPNQWPSMDGTPQSSNALSNAKPKLTGIFVGSRRSSIFVISSKEQRAIRTLLVVFVCFVILWFPFFTLQLIVAFSPAGTVSSNLLFDFAWPGYVSSGINPVIYAIFNLEYKDSMRDLIVSLFSRCSLHRRKNRN